MAALIQKTKKQEIKTEQVKKLTLKLEDQINQEEFLIEYVAGIKNGNFYEEPVKERISIGKFQPRLTVDFLGGLLSSILFGIHEIQYLDWLVLSN